jgi:hypothetical protein
MSSINPLSQAEADLVFDKSDRAAAKLRKQQRNVGQLAIDLRNCDQRIKRNHQNAAIALDEWFADYRRGLARYEECAERIQIDVWKRDAIIKDIKETLEARGETP